MRCTTAGCCRCFRIGGALANGESHDARLVRALVVPLGRFAEGMPLPNGEVSKGGMYYDCRMLAPNGDCLIYEARPQMCRDYPGRGGCQKQGCTYTP